MRNMIDGGEYAAAAGGGEEFVMSLYMGWFLNRVRIEMSVNRRVIQM